MHYVEQQPFNTVPATYNDLLGVMTNRPDKHLHFARTGPTAPFGYPGIDNPLDHLVPEALVSAGYRWVVNFSAVKSTFFLEDHDALDWMTVWPDSSLVLPDTLERNDLSGGVDLFLACWCQGWDQIGPPPSTYVMPQKIFWELKEYDSASSSWISVFSRYVVDFDGELGNSGSAPSDWEEFKRFYFAYLGGSLLIGDSYISCLTNCGDAEGWDGINNIEENCWQTDSDNQFSGVATNPVLAAFPDGPYRIDVTSYAWDTTVTHGDTIDVELHNFDPVVEKVIIECAGRTIWEAYWTADGLTPEWHNPSDQGVLPDQQLDVTVVFSEPMDTTSVTVTAGASSPYNDITASDAGLNWSWTNCPEEA